MESMSEAPYLVPKARFGARLGNTEMIDSMVHDGLWSTFTKQHMGESSDEVNRELEIEREEQDEWAARSHQRAHRAWENGALGEEVVAVTMPARRGETVTVARDEGIRSDATPESLAKLAPAFKRDGTITAAFASVAINSTRMLRLDEDRVNVNGGAVALGHPIGASGARLVLTLAHELKRRGAKVGAAALCGGGGQGDALIISRD